MQTERAQKNPQRERVRKREQSKPEAGGGEPLERRFIAMLGLDRANEQIKRDVEEEEEKHLRQSGKRVLPHRITENDKTTGQQSEMLVE